MLLDQLIQNRTSPTLLKHADGGSTVKLRILPFSVSSPGARLTRERQQRGISLTKHITRMSVSFMNLHGSSCKAFTCGGVSKCESVRAGCK